MAQSSTSGYWNISLSIFALVMVRSETQESGLFPPPHFLLVRTIHFRSTISVYLISASLVTKESLLNNRLSKFKGYSFITPQSNTPSLVTRINLCRCSTYTLLNEYWKRTTSKIWDKIMLNFFNILHNFKGHLSTLLFSHFCYWITKFCWKQKNITSRVAFNSTGLPLL